MAGIVVYFFFVSLSLMKKTLIHSILLILTLSISYGGSGFSYMIYCCSDCEAFGLNSVLNGKCCETHHHHLEESEDGCIKFYHTDHDSFCDMERLTVNWLSESVSFPTLQPVIIDLNLFFFHKQLYPIPLANMGQDLLCKQDMTLVSPKEYLSLLTVLII